MNGRTTLVDAEESAYWQRHRDRLSPELSPARRRQGVWEAPPPNRGQPLRSPLLPTRPSPHSGGVSPGAGEGAFQLLHGSVGPSNRSPPSRTVHHPAVVRQGPNRQGS